MSSVLPSSDKPFLHSVLASLKKRSKAIKHSVKSLRCERVIEKDGSSIIEKLEIDVLKYCALPRNLSLRAFVWEDRWIWLDYRVPSKTGWVWEWTYDGKFLGHDGRRFVEAFEASFHASRGCDADATAGRSKLWKPLLARGPRLHLA